MQRLGQGLALALIATLAVACGGGGATGAPATSAPSAGASAPAGAGLAVVAKDMAFQPTALTAKADAPFTIDFDNQDSAPHNIAIKDTAGNTLFKGDIVTGTKTTYAVPAMPAGTYAFWCEVHPNMTGTLTVQ